LHPPGARDVRARGVAGREPGAADEPAGAPLHPLDHRALPRPDGGAEPERNPPEGAAEDLGFDLAAGISGLKVFRRAGNDLRCRLFRPNGGATIRETPMRSSLGLIAAATLFAASGAMAASHPSTSAPKSPSTDTSTQTTTPPDSSATPSDQSSAPPSA